MGRSTTSRLTPAEIADSIRRQILRGELEPGAAMRQDELAASLAISRVPVREALRSLVAEGLITWESQRGFRVARLAPVEAREILEIRAVLEVQALEWAFANIDKTALAAAENALKRARVTKSLDEWSELNAAFHGALLAPCGRPQLLAMIQALNNRTDRYIRLLVARADYRRRAEREHRAILAAVEVGNLPAAISLLRQHIEDTSVWLERFLTEEAR